MCWESGFVSQAFKIVKSTGKGEIFKAFFITKQNYTFFKLIIHKIKIMFNRLKTGLLKYCIVNS